jgi:hypothetical protein
MCVRKSRAIKLNNIMLRVPTNDSLQLGSVVVCVRIVQCRITNQIIYISVNIKVGSFFSLSFLYTYIGSEKFTKNILRTKNEMPLIFLDFLLYIPLLLDLNFNSYEKLLCFFLFRLVFGGILYISAI